MNVVDEGTWHVLLLDPEPWDAVHDGGPLVTRDRGFAVGDVLVLKRKENDPDLQPVQYRRVTGVKEMTRGHVCLTLEPK